MKGLTELCHTQKHFKARAIKHSVLFNFSATYDKTRQRSKVIGLVVVNISGAGSGAAVSTLYELVSSLFVYGAQVNTDRYLLIYQVTILLSRAFTTNYLIILRDFQTT